MKVLVVEDEIESARLTVEIIEDSGFEATWCELVVDAVAKIKLERFDIVLLDLNLPDFHGFEAIRSIRESGNTPVIVISAYSDMATKLQAFHFGANDYLTKPYNAKELIARMWSLARLKSGLPIEKEPKKAIEYDEKKQQFFFNNGALLLTSLEHDVLFLLYKSKNSVVPRASFEEIVYLPTGGRGLDYHIKNLRKKLGDDGIKQRYIKSVYASGYILSI